MSLNLKQSSWAKPLLVLVGLVVIVGLWAHVAGGIFLMTHHRPFGEATPLTLYQYWTYYGDDESVQRWILISGGVSLAVIFLPVIFFLVPKSRSLYGDARFAKTREVKKAGLFGEKGIIVGLLGNKYLMFGGSQHVIMSAPTRGGKGVGVVIPNLLTWPDSVVVLDVKQENHAITSGYRQKHGQQCYLFNPAATDYRTHRFNALAYISPDANFRIDDIQKIAGMLFPDVQGTDPIWTATPRSLFLGIVLFLLETPTKLVSIGQVLRESLADGDGAKYFAGIINTRALAQKIKQSSDDKAKAEALSDVSLVLADKGNAPGHHPKLAEMAVWAHISSAYKQTLEEVSAERAAADSSLPNLAKLVASTSFDKPSADVGRALSGPCVRALNSYITIASENTRSGVMTSFRSRLELWNNPLVDAATSANDFDLRDVRKKRMTVYLGVTPDNLDRMAPLLNLFFQLLIDLNTRELPERNKSLKYQCLLLCDEFTAMGKVNVLSKGISYIAGYGLRMLPIIQSPAQIVDVYGKEAAQTFTTNHALQIVFPPKASELETAKNISEWLGYQTVDGVSESKGKGIFGKKSASQSTSDQRRALLLPQEITSLGAKRELVVVEDCPPILAEKIRYFDDPVFVDRLKSVSPKLKDLGRKLPTQAQLHAVVIAGGLSAPVPLINVTLHEANVAKAVEGGNGLAGPGRTRTVTIERPIRSADMVGLESLPLSRFALRLNDVPPPDANAKDALIFENYADEMCSQCGVAVPDATALEAHGSTQLEVYEQAA